MNGFSPRLCKSRLLELSYISDKCQRNAREIKYVMLRPLPGAQWHFRGYGSLQLYKYWLQEWKEFHWGSMRMYFLSEMDSFILKIPLCLFLLRDLSSRCRACRCSFGRVAALHAERDRCVGAGQGCGEAAGGNFIAGPEGTGWGRTPSQFDLEIALAEGSQNAVSNVYNTDKGEIETGWQ